MGSLNGVVIGAGIIVKEQPSNIFEEEGDHKIHDAVCSDFDEVKVQKTRGFFAHTRHQLSTPK